MRVIDENGQNLGILATSNALRTANERGLDLVEVSPLARPPVCRLTDFGKYLYQLEKQERQNRAKQKRIDVKGIRLSLKIGDHDAAVRRSQTLKFLEAGHKVKVEMILRGRERYYGDRAKEKMREFLSSFENAIRIEQPMTLQGNRLTAIISK